eukprot:1844159-Pleurochrysis_carterae.AAC.1
MVYVSIGVRADGIKLHALIITSSSAGDRPWYGLARRPSPKRVGGVPGLEAIGSHPPTGSQRPRS